MNFDKGPADRLIGARRDAAVRCRINALAGAGMLPDWKHSQLGSINPCTNKGVVWGGNNPIYRDEFEQYYYRGPDDDKLNGAINSVEEGNILMNNHGLIASNSDDNKKALKNMHEIVAR